MEPPTAPPDAERARPCVVVTGGDAVPAGALRHLPPDALVIGVDSGVAHATALGLHVDVAVGDFDSLPAEALAAVTAAGARVERHPVAKDATDLELGLAAALASGARQVVVLGGHGGRLDHFLANALLLAAPPFASLAITAHMGPATVTVARPTHPATVTGTPGAVVSLLPVGGAAVGVTTTGLRYPLHGEDLAPGTTRGVSNELTAPAATAALEGGTLLVVQPGRDLP
jgi:thiamine pyrophosphokinase